MFTGAAIMIGMFIKWIKNKPVRSWFREKFFRKKKDP